MILKVYRQITKKNTIEEYASDFILYLIQCTRVIVKPNTKKSIEIPVYVPHKG